MKIAIVGSREFDNYPNMKAFLDISLYAIKVKEIISGGAIGADTLAERYAKENNIPTRIIEPNYSLYPSYYAPIVRNEIIVKEADFIFIFWNRVSKGTQSVISYCKKYNKPHKIYHFGDLHVD